MAVKLAPWWSMPLALFGLALLIRLSYCLAWGFDGLYGQDAFAYFTQARAILERSAQGRLPPSDFFWPNGFPGLVAVSMLVLGKSALAAQIISLGSGAALAPLCYSLSRELFSSRRAAILAGLLIASTGQAILSSLVIMADMLALFWATLAAWLLVRSWRTDRRGGWLLSAGAALGLAVITRWLYILLAPAFGLALIYQLGFSRRLWWQLSLPVISGLLVIGPQILLSLGRPEGLAHSWLLGWRPANAVLREFSTVDGHALYRLPNGLFYAQPLIHPSYLFPIFGAAAVWGAVRLWQQRVWGPLILLLGWSGLVYGFLAGIPYQNFRFSLTLYPPLILLAAFGSAEIWERFKSRWIGSLVAGLGLLGMLVWSHQPIQRFLDQQARDKASVRQVAERLPASAPVIAFGLTLTLRHYTQLQVHELYELDAQELASLLDCHATSYLLVNPANLESQWRGSSLEQRYHWLKTQTRMRELATFPPYVLSTVQAAQPEQTGGAPCESP